MDVEKRAALWLLATHPRDALPVLVGMQDGAIVSLLLELTPTDAAGVVVALGPTRGAAVLGQMPVPGAQSVLGCLSRPLARELLRRLPTERREALLEALPRAVAVSMRQALASREGTVGALVDTDVVALAGDLKVTEAVRHLKNLSSRSVDSIYVVDLEFCLEGVVDPSALLIEGGSRRLRDVMNTDFKGVSVRAGLHSLLSHPAWGSGSALPVVDQEGRLVGTIRHRVVQDAVARKAPSTAAASTVTSVALGQLFRAGIEGLLGTLAPGMKDIPKSNRRKLRGH